MTISIDPTLTIGDLLVAISLAVAAIGLGMNWSALRRNRELERVDLALSLIGRLLDDSEVRKFFYKIDYDKFRFSTDSLEEFKGSADERNLDALLYQYDYLSRMVRRGLVKVDDVEFLLFEMIQVMKNDNVVSYLTWLDLEYKRHGNLEKNARVRPHDDARWLVDSLRNGRRVR